MTLSYDLDNYLRIFCYFQEEHSVKFEILLPKLDFGTEALWSACDIEHFTDVDESWYPKEKVDFARRKLHGDNCAHIMR